jgi:hypothetical protein
MLVNVSNQKPDRELSALITIVFQSSIYSRSSVYTPVKNWRETSNCRVSSCSISEDESRVEHVSADQSCKPQWFFSAPIYEGGRSSTLQMQQASAKTLQAFFSEICGQQPQRSSIIKPPKAIPGRRNRRRRRRKGSGSCCTDRRSSRSRSGTARVHPCRRGKRRCKSS